MFECSNCKRKLEDGTNFCPKCGVKQDVSDRCPICLENKKLSTLLCGHNVCITCMNRIHQIKQTLKKNLNYNINSKHKIEFIIVDFGSSDGLKEYVLESLSGSG